MNETNLLCTYIPKLIKAQCYIVKEGSYELEL